MLKHSNMNAFSESIKLESSSNHQNYSKALETTSVFSRQNHENTIRYPTLRHFLRQVLVSSKPVCIELIIQIQARRWKSKGYRDEFECHCIQAIAMSSERFEPKIAHSCARRALPNASISGEKAFGTPTDRESNTMWLFLSSWDCRRDEKQLLPQRHHDSERNKKKRRSSL